MQHFVFEKRTPAKTIFPPKSEEGIWQIVPSPDGKYILYAERIYRGTGITDDENVYYKVYSIEDNTNTTIYSGYKKSLLVDWE